jgi:amino acid adenylation domain-containing protein
MSNAPTNRNTLPPEQQTIRDKCFHPSGTFVEFPIEDVEKSIPERFEKIVEQYPDRVAVKIGDRALTYVELNQAANRLARAILGRQGVGNEPVAIFLEHGAPVIIAILGILKAGKIFVVVEPSFPEERIKYLLEDSQARLLVGGTDGFVLTEGCLREGTHLINIDELESNFTSEDLKLRLSPDSLAALVYTSGSTGRPKGVMQNHRNILHTILRDTDAVHISPHDRLALLRCPSTSGAIADLFDGLLNGAAVYPYRIAKDGFVRLGAWLMQEEITIFNSVSSSFRHFVSALSGESFAHLRLIYIGGEPVYTNDVAIYKNHFADDCILVVRMGCGEAGKVCQYMIDKRTELLNNDMPVGYPHEDLEILILDEVGERMKLGAIGEIAIKSRFLSPGYWRMPEMTKSRFLLDQNGGDERIYLSGDVGRLTPDGCLFHMGRSDSQVKIRGYQVEVVEIERVLLQHNGIKEAIVTSQEDHAGEMRLVAYWVPNKCPGPTVSELRRFLRKELPDYMIPSVFVMLETMPKTPTGKLDRRALRVPDDSRPELDNSYVAPRNLVEEELANIWADVLGIKRVGICDTFADLGGHSLRAMQVISRIIAKFKVELPINFLLNSPTVAEMAVVISNHQGKKLGENELERVLTELESLSDEETIDLVRL